MKRKYETPVVMAEMYKANAYCGACNKTLNGQLTVDADHAYANNSGTPWKPRSGFSITVGDLTHTFPANPTTTSTGLCGGGFGQSQHSEAEREQSIWECNCPSDAHDGTWFLEWSHYYSVHVNGTSTFFLYKDTNGNGNFDIYSGSVNSLPQQSGNSDTNVALVNYGVINVVNS